MAGLPWDAVPILKRLRARGQADATAHAVAFSSVLSPEPVRITYKELADNVEEVAQVVLRLLASREDGVPKHVAFLVNPSIAYVVVELAIWAAGGVAVPLSVHSPAPELEYFCEDSQAPLLITDEAMAKVLQPVAEKLSRTCVVVSPAASSTKVALSGGDAAACGEEVVSMSLIDNALILYTSGTTGKPKGVVHTVASLTAQMESLSSAWQWTCEDYTLHVLPLHHIHGVQNILNTALFNGATVEFTPFDSAHCLQRLTSSQVTCFHAVPTIYVKFTQYLEKLGMESAATAAVCAGLRNEKLRLMVCGSAALPVPTMKSWAQISGHVLLERYGMTEIGMGLSNKYGRTLYPGCVGWPLPQQEVKVDEQGNIMVRGAPLFKEYWCKEEATLESFTEDGWFLTGDNCQVGGCAEELQVYRDLAREVEAGTGRPKAETTALPSENPDLGTIHKIMGRTSVDIIKSGGYKISALEIESVLLQHEKIIECAVVGKPDETWGEKVTAVCILGGDLPIKELRDWGKERMATYKVPQELVVVTELPRNQLGKLEKKKILESWKISN